MLAHYPAKDVTSWLGNSPKVANDHYAMTMQASFDRAIVDGAVIAGVTRTVLNKQKPIGQMQADEVGVRTARPNAESRTDANGVLSEVPPKVPRTLQENVPLNEDTKKADCKKPVNNWARLQSAVADLPLSYPTRT